MNILANNCISYVSIHVFRTVLQFSDGVDSASLSRKTRKCTCYDLCKFFISTPKTAEKNKPTNSHRNCELWQLRFLSKIVNLFHNDMQVWYLLIKFCQRETMKPWKFMFTFPSFWPIRFAQWTRNEKITEINYIRQGGFLGNSSTDSFPQIALLFAARVRGSKVSLLVGYWKCKMCFSKCNFL